MPERIEAIRYLQKPLFSCSSSRGVKGVSIIFFNYRKMAQTMAFCAYYVTINLEMSQILPFVWVPVAANGAKNGTWP